MKERKGERRLAFDPKNGDGFYADLLRSLVVQDPSCVNGTAPLLCSPGPKPYSLDEFSKHLKTAVGKRRLSGLEAAELLSSLVAERERLSEFYEFQSERLAAWNAANAEFGLEWIGKVRKSGDMYAEPEEIAKVLKPYKEFQERLVEAEFGKPLPKLGKEIVIG